jgi:hypothetical protein
VMNCRRKRDLSKRTSPINGGLGLYFICLPRQVVVVLGNGETAHAFCSAVCRLHASRITPFVLHTALREVSLSQVTW